MQHPRAYTGVGGVKGAVPPLELRAIILSETEE